MSNFQWRRFNFFEFSKDVPGGNLAELLEDSLVTCTSSGRGHLILGDSSGFLHILGRTDLSPTTLRVFDIVVLQAVQLRQSGILVLVGLDSEPSGSTPFLKAYNTDKLDPKSGHPLLLRSSKILTPSVVSALAVHENQSLIALGFGDGTLQLWRGDISRSRGVRVRHLSLGGGAETPLTGLSLRTGASGTFLYASSQNDVYSFNVTAKDKEIKVHLDSDGCRKGLSMSVDMNSETHFVVGRKDAVYCYNSETCTHLYAFEGEKSFLYWFRNYLVIASAAVEEESECVVLSIFDVQNKFIAYSGEVPKVSALFSEWGSLYILSNNRISILSEKDTQSKLNILFKKNFYDIAIKIAKNQRYDADGLIDIFRQYGDHLYVKGDFSGAIENYCKTIGQLEPSYVIRRFLDAQRIENLTVYLQALHRREAANEDHTTLLLNCYTKLKDEKKLSEFIMTEDREVDFDVDVAVKVCRQAGYFDHALSLAKKHNKHGSVLKIQLEDRKNYESAAEYISGLDPLSVETSLRKYGSALVAVLPEKATEMALTSCKSGGVPPEEYIHLFIRKPKQMVVYLERILEAEWDEDLSPQIYNTLLEYYLSDLPSSEEKVLNLLRTGHCNPDHALILCKNASCKAGLLYLYEKKRIYNEILLFHVKEGDMAAALETCRKFGDEDRQLWVSALRLIPKQPCATAEIMSEVLETIESLKLLSPMEVINILTSTPGATLGLVREYLLRYMQSEQEIIDENNRAISEYRAETEKIRTKIHSLENEPVVFQCSKCSACSEALDLPSVHFLCKHSFHKQCVVSFSESENECPVCHKENKRILDIISSQESNKAANEAFHYQLETAQDGFSLVAQYFGRGLFRGDEDLLSIIHEAAKGMSSSSSSKPFLPVVAASESRIRMEEGGKSRPSSAIASEARLRVGQGSANTSLMSESRLRSQVPASVPQSISDARLRLNEGSKPSSSYSSNASLNKGASSSPAHTRISSKPSNKQAATDSNNPFDQEESPLDEDNPFYEGNESGKGTNPFGDDDDYDESLNPFS